jgi:hypothetical protein
VPCVFRGKCIRGSEEKIVMSGRNFFVGVRVLFENVVAPEMMND